MGGRFDVSLPVRRVHTNAHDAVEGTSGNHHGILAKDGSGDGWMVEETIRRHVLGLLSLRSSAPLRLDIIPSSET
jgi:hypothetical protein